MRLYEVTNGYMGASYVRCLVIAENEERALELAKEQYKNKDSREKYWNNLYAECICEDVTKEFAGDVADE
jgi:hypothetical protein